MKKIKILIWFFTSLIFSQYTGAQIQYWNEANGGAGTWSPDATNWIYGEGGNDIWQGGTAIFPAKGGTVTVESNTSSPLLFQELRFQHDGYILDGGYLSIKNPEDNNNGYIFVGKSMNATIRSIIQNGSNINALMKTGKGTLILEGANRHTGGTYIMEGALSVDNDKPFGENKAHVVLNEASLIITGENFNTSDRPYIFENGNCSIYVAEATNNLSVTQRIQGPGNFFKAGPGSLTVPADYYHTGMTTVLDGTLTFVNGVDTAVMITPVDVKAGEVIFDRIQNTRIVTGALTGSGTFKKEGKGTLTLSEPVTATGNFNHNTGILDIADKVSFNGNVICKDTVLLQGAVTFYKNLTLEGNVIRYDAKKPIEINGNLSIENTSVFQLTEWNEDMAPLVLLSVTGSKPDDDEINEKLEIKIGRKIINSNSDYILSWYNGELFLRDKTKPFPPKYTVDLTVAPGIETNLSTGKYNFERNEYFYLTFIPTESSISNDDMLLLVDGTPVKFNNPGDGIRCSYFINPVKDNHTVAVALKTYTVTIPLIEGVTTIPAAGDYEAPYGEKFTLKLTVDDQYDQSDIVVYMNGVIVDPDPLRQASYTYTVNAITGPLDIEIEGVEANPTGNISIEKQVQLYSDNGILYIETPSPATVSVYNVTGRLSAQQKTETGLTSIPLPKGIYIVLINDDAQKVIVR